MNLRDKQIQHVKMYNNTEKQEDDYMTQSQARQEELKAIIRAVDYDIDLTLVLGKKGLACILSKLPSLN